MLLVGWVKLAVMLPPYCFFLEDCVQRRDRHLPDNTTCTDKLQQWHIPPKRSINPAPVSNIEFRKAEYGKEQEDRPKPTSYDPRHQNDRTLNPEHVEVKLSNVRCFGIFPESRHRCSDSEEEAMKLIVHAPELGIGLTNPCFGTDPSGSQFADDCAEYARSQKVAPEIACRVERVTRGQSNNSLWRSLRNGRITSS